jgi:uncharacterized damage-inducible protein DinB
VTDDERPDPRTEPPLSGGEAQLAFAFLDYHRETLMMKVAGLDSAQLATALPPSPMTLGGLVKHLALVEESWFCERLGGRELAEPWASVDWDADEDWDWHSAVDDEPDALLGQWERSVAMARECADGAMAAAGFDQMTVQPNRRGEHFSMRWIVIHMIEEYARHNGHADMIRESIDGQTGE